MLKEFFQKAGKTLSDLYYGSEYDRALDSWDRAVKSARADNRDPDQCKTCRQLESKLDRLKPLEPTLKR